MENLDLPKPQTDLPLPQKEIPATTNVKFSILKSKIFIGFVALSLLLAFLAGGFMLGKNSVLKELNPTSPTIPPKDPVVYDPTADWQTFERNNYSFKYPNASKVLPEDEVNDINLQLSNRDIIHVISQNNSGNLSSRDWLEKEFPSSESVTFNNISIAGKDSVQKNDYSATHINLGTGKILTISFVKCDGPRCEGGTDIETFQQILSTFKFTDSEEIPSAKDKDVFCAQDAKQCSDGSYVGRSGPNCEFDSCPTQ